MDILFPSLNYLIYLALAVFFLFVSLNSFRDGYTRAGTVAGLFSLLPALICFFFHGWSFFHLTGPVFLLILISVPLSGFRDKLLLPERRFDERDISFSRHRLKPGSENYTSYYGKNPEKEESDKRTRALPGLLAEKSRYFHRLNSVAADARFFLLNQLRDSVDGPVAKEIGNNSTREIADYLYSTAIDDNVSIYGTASLKPEHCYSHVGSGAGQYGEEITVSHKYAIVLGSEMKPRITATAPMSPEVVETGRRYVDCAVWAVQTASFIRSLGYSARAHIDGNYQVIPPFVADEAGLGGFGWSNLFLTEKFGPRVRYSVVTTDLELPLPDKRKKIDFLSFCRICRKCATCCPSRAINHHYLEKLDSDRCFMYWNAVGTDCGKCLAVCPMGHPWGILKTLALRSMPAAWLLKKLDDLFYGKKPRSLPLPGWMETEK